MQLDPQTIKQRIQELRNLKVLHTQVITQNQKLRAENRQLKTRVKELEGIVETVYTVT